MTKHTPKGDKNLNSTKSRDNSRPREEVLRKYEKPNTSSNKDTILDVDVSTVSNKSDNSYNSEKDTTK